MVDDQVTMERPRAATEIDKESNSAATGMLERTLFPVVELHAGLGFSRKSDRHGAQQLMRDEVHWGKISNACANAVSVWKEESVKIALVAIFSFPDGDSAVKSVVALWKLRLQGLHRLTPVLGFVSMEMERKLDEELRTLFLAHMTELREGQLMKGLSEEAEKLRKIFEESRFKIKKKYRRLNEFLDLKASLIDFSFQRSQALQNIEEFKTALKSIEETMTNSASQQYRPFLLGPHWTWCQLQSVLERECERLDAHLPLYSWRSDILTKIHSNQVTVLVGETGSGKSTQLVQYLADAGFANAGKSIVCTQPRKVAAISLAGRVQEETDGCLQHTSPVGCVTSLGAHNDARFAEITFTTDFVLLQLCLKDRYLSKFSCVVVDEAHERSLNTDLLLALLKSCVSKRDDLKVVIMSATADADLLCAYFGGLEVFRVPGRSFPVRVIYEPENASTTGDSNESGYSSRVVRKVLALHKMDEEGNILAFLTSPAEVDSACGRNFGASAVVLPLHGRLQSEELQRVFQPNSMGKRKIVFATNFAETSLTIPDVKFVVDCGLAKGSTFDPHTGMNVLKVGKIDQSSAIQRSGRAGRTQAGVSYRLYSQHEFDEMASHRLPEIKRVHLGLAVLRLLALGINEPNKFDFIEAPAQETILLALQGLEQLGAVKQLESGLCSLTYLGWRLVRLGIEPRLGKVILDSIEQGYGQDGLVIAALMSHSKSIFFRSGSEEMKAHADLLKMRFCHPHGDLFTLLSVYQEWDSLPEHSRNKWCMNNCISAKSLRKCRDQVHELRACLRHELDMKVPYRCGWSSRDPLENCTPLRKIIFSALSANLAVFSGHPRVGYDVTSLGQEAYLHPSSAVLVFGAMPEFVVFGEIIHTSSTFLVFVTVVDPSWIMPLCPSIKYDVGVLQNSIMRRWVVPMTSSNLLSRVCGKQGHNLILLIKKIKKQFNQRCIIDYNYDNTSLSVFTTLAQMAEAKLLVQRCIEIQRRWLENECVEKFPVGKSGTQIPFPTLLIGAGGMIRDVLMPGDYSAVEVMYESPYRLDASDDEEILGLFDQCGEGISGFEKFSPVSHSEKAGKEVNVQCHKWGVIRFCSRSGAEVAVELLNGIHVKNAILCLRPLIGSTTNDFKRSPFPAVKATLTWARRRRKGRASITCSPEDMQLVLAACQVYRVCGSVVSAKPDRSKVNCIFLTGLNLDVDEKTLQDDLFEISGCRNLDVFMPRSCVPLCQPQVTELHQTLTQEIASFISPDKFQVTVFEPKEKDYMTRAEIRFEHSAHEGGAFALAHLEGLVLPGCHSWQKISYKRVFSTTVHFSRLVLGVIKKDLFDLVAALQQQHRDTKLLISTKDFGFNRVQIIGTSLAIVAGCKSAIEKLLEGQSVVDDNLGDLALSLLFTKKGAQLAKGVEVRTQTLVMCDKRTRTAKIYGPKDKKAAAQEDLLSGLAKLHSEDRCRQVCLRGDGMPSGLMREIVKQYGPDLSGLRELAGVGVNINMDLRDHVLYVEGGGMDAVTKVQAAVADVARFLASHRKSENWLVHLNVEPGISDQECAICFCPREDPYVLEGCGHGFCRTCLINQVNSSIRHRDGFPLTCAHDGCSQLFLLVDICALLTEELQEDLRSASLCTFVAQSPGRYRFCPTPDCPNIYRTSTTAGYSFVCAACSVQLCTACHVEYHEDLSCEEYQKFKLDPDASLHAWRKGKEKDVKNCPGCSSVIEKIDGCNHMTCKCGKHVCWVCLCTFGDPHACYDHLRAIHGGMGGDGFEYLP